MHVGQLNKFLVDCNNEYIVVMVIDFNDIQGTNKTKYINRVVSH